MNAAILYGSSHGKTRKVVTAAAQRLGIYPTIHNVADLPSAAALAQYELLLFFCPTYGDEELQEDMERFLVGFDGTLAGKAFAICELGSYYGYDDFSFGAMPIIRATLLKLNAWEICEPLSLDSFPRLNWDHLFDWVAVLNERIQVHV